MLDERLHRRVRGALEIIRLAVLRGGDHQRPVLGADGVIGRHHPRLAVAGNVRAADKIHDVGAGAEVEDQASPCALDLCILAAARAAQDGRHHGERRDRLRQLRRHEHRRAIALQPPLGQRDKRDHALIGVARAVAEREDAVLVQDQSFDVGLGVVDVRRHLRQREARHHVGNHAHPSVIEIGADGFAIRLVDEAQDGVGVGVVDKFVRQEGVQQGFDRRVRRRGLEQVFALNAHHVLVGEFGAGAQLAQTVEAHGRQSRGLDHGHVRARAFDAEHRDLLAEQVGHDRLHRGVAATVQHKLGIAPEQAGGVDARGKVAADALRRIAVDRRLRLAIHPAAFHRAFLSRNRTATTGACPRRRCGDNGRSDRDASAPAEHTLAPPSGTARAIAALVLRRARHHRLCRRHRRSGGRRGSRSFVAQDLGHWLTHGRAPPRSLRRGGFGND